MKEPFKLVIGLNDGKVEYIAASGPLELQVVERDEDAREEFVETRYSSESDGDMNVVQGVFNIEQEVFEYRKDYGG